VRSERVNHATIAHRLRLTRLDAIAVHVGGAEIRGWETRGSKVAASGGSSTFAEGSTNAREVSVRDPEREVGGSALLEGGISGISGGESGREARIESQRRSASASVSSRGSTEAAFASSELSGSQESFEISERFS